MIEKSRIKAMALSSGFKLKEQAKKEREFQEKVFADCDKWDNRELGADEAYAKKADMCFGVMAWRDE